MVAAKDGGVVAGNDAGGGNVSDDAGAPPAPGDMSRHHHDGGIGGASDMAMQQQQGPSDMAMMQQQGNADFAVANGALRVDSVWPPSGPVGSYLDISGSGFQNGDTVALQGQNVPLTTLSIVTLSASLIVAVVPMVNVQLPANVTVQVNRGNNAYPQNGLPFSIISGHVYYAAPNGSDNNAGTIDKPWASMSGAAGKMKAGDVTYFRAGTYSASVSLHGSGSAGAPITFAGYPGESALITTGNGDTISVYGSYLTFDHLHISCSSGSGQGIAIVAGYHDVTISYCEVANGKGQGITVSGNSNLIYHNLIHDNGSHAALDHGIYVEGGSNVIRSNTIYNNWAYGIQLYDEAGTVEAGNTIEYNYIYHNGYGATSLGNDYLAGLIVATGHPNSVVRYNRFCDNSQYGILFENNEPGSQITNNVFCYNGVGGVYTDSVGAGTSITGNVFYNDANWELSSVTGVTSNNNTYEGNNGSPNLQWNGKTESLANFQAGSGQDKNSVVADPKFKNVPANAFDPNSAGSYDFCTQLIPQLCTPAP
jgi:parallel beta-helix repeat protein